MALLISDVHIGFDRVTGTTPFSRERIRTNLLNGLNDLLFVVNHAQTHLVIAGDLFDKFSVSNLDLWDAFQPLHVWLSKSGHRLSLIAGNHDHSPRADAVSSFQLLARWLKAMHGDSVQVLGINEVASLDTGIAALAHCENQTVFDQRLAELLPNLQAGEYLILHANYNNNFAAQSDHSLNVSEAQAKAFADKGVTLLFAHEHQARTALGGKVICMGNQWPTSISDCLGNDEKYAHVLTIGDDMHTTEFGTLTTWRTSDTETGFTRVDWRDLASCTYRGFIRVTGEAEATEASEVVDTIARARQRSDALVIANAVKTKGAMEVESLPEAFDAAAKFDVLDYIKQHLDADEAAVVDTLLESIK